MRGFLLRVFSLEAKLHADPHQRLPTVLTEEGPQLSRPGQRTRRPGREGGRGPDQVSGSSPVHMTLGKVTATGPHVPCPGEK